MHTAILVRFRYDTLMNRPTLDTLSDEALLVRIADHDEVAFEVFCRRFLKWAFRFDMNVLQNCHEAEDAVQEKFLRIWSKAGKYKPLPESRVTNYLLKIDKNICLDMLRRRYRQLEIFGADNREMDDRSQEDVLDYLAYCHVVAESDVPDSEGMMASSELASRIYEYTRSHFKNRQFLVFWGFISGLSYKELAETYAMEQGSVRGYVARSFASIRNAFAVERGNHD
jgi:RNA polymerase sigma factor (sigma-70 family)